MRVQRKGSEKWKVERGKNKPKHSLMQQEAKQGKRDTPQNHMGFQRKGNEKWKVERGKRRMCAEERGGGGGKI